VEVVQGAGDDPVESGLDAGDDFQAVEVVTLHDVAAEERIARDQRPLRVGREQAVRLDRHRRFPIVEEVLVGDHGPGAARPGRRPAPPRRARASRWPRVPPGLWTEPPPYWNWASSMTATAPEVMARLPHRARSGTLPGVGCRPGPPPSESMAGTIVRRTLA